MRIALVTGGSGPGLLGVQQTGYLTKAPSTLPAPFEINLGEALKSFSYLLKNIQSTNFFINSSTTAI
jgi:hypothetical protein